MLTISPIVCSLEIEDSDSENEPFPLDNLKPTNDEKKKVSKTNNICVPKN